MKRQKILWTSCVVILCLCGGYMLRTAHVSPPPRRSDSVAAPAAKAAVSYPRLPLSFEVNQGQTDNKVKFISRGRGYALFLTGDEMVLSLRGQKPEGRSQKTNGRLENRLSKFETRNSGFSSVRSGGINQDTGIFDLPSLLPRPETLIRNPKSEIQNRLTTSAQSPATSTLRLRLVNANPQSKVVGLDPLPGKANYFIGNDPKQWRTNVPTYARVKYQGVYPGIDLVYYGNQSGELEHDFIVAPGADPRTIRFATETGHSKLKTRNSNSQIQILNSKIDANGDLVIPTNTGDVRFRKPVVYQEQSAVSSNQKAANATQKTDDSFNPKSKIENPKSVDGRFVLLAENRVGFEVADYDRTRPLVIDPVLVYSTYLGGSGGDQGLDVAVDSSGSAYVTGTTYSTDFPTANPLEGNCDNCALDNLDAFVAKLDPAGSTLVYSSYFGGSRDDRTTGIALDQAGNAYVTGTTNSADLSVTPGAFQTERLADMCGDSSFSQPCNNAFVSKLNPDGSELVYSTFLGGRRGTVAYGIAVDSSGNAYLTGTTDPTGFPTKNPIPGTSGNLFITKLNAAGSALVYSTLMGGNAGEVSGGIAVDSSGNTYVTGTTWSTTFPTVNPIQASNRATGGTAFVTKLNSAGSALLYSTYLGGSLWEAASRIAVDPSGNAYVTGITQSADFPTVNALQPSLVGNSAGFVAKLNAAGTALVYSTYLGGSSISEGKGIAADSSGNAYVTGSTWSADFPTVNPVQASCRSCSNFRDAFVTKFNPDGSALLYSTFLGGSVGDEGVGITVDSFGAAYITGSSDSTDFPVVNPFQATLSSGTDAFVAKIALSGAAPSVIFSPASLSFGPYGIGAPSEPLTVTVTNGGTTDLTISGIAVGGSHASDFALSDETCTASPIPANATCTVSVIFTPSTTEARTALLTFSDDAVDSPQKVSLTGWGGLAVPVADVSPTSLTFENQLQDTQGEFQPVIVRNTGDATLTIADTMATANFGFVRCGPSVAPGDSCTINVFFSPIAIGPLTGTLTIIDDSNGLAGSKQTVALSGTAQRFRLSAAPGSSTSATVRAGQSATYSLSAVGEGGFNQSVDFTCIGAPTEATCTVSPNPATVGSSPTDITVTVKTTARSDSPPRPRWLPPARPFLAHLRNVLMLALSLAAMAWAARRRNQWGSIRWQSAVLPLAASVLLLLAGCGGAGGSGSDNPGTPAGTYSLLVRGTAGSLLSRQIREVTLTLKVT